MKIRFTKTGRGADLPAMFNTGRSKTPGADPVNTLWVEAEDGRRAVLHFSDAELDRMVNQLYRYRLTDGPSTTTWREAKPPAQPWSRLRDYSLEQIKEWRDNNGGALPRSLEDFWSAASDEDGLTDRKLRNW